MYKNGERSMAWIAMIDNVETHPNADALDICTVGGWKVVSQKGIYRKGDLAVYASIDSWIPTEVAPFLTKGDQEPREYNGVKGERLKTVRLRGQISQGLLLPLSEIPETWDDGVLLSNEDLYNEGDDVTEILGIQKYEPPIPACLSGEVKGLFPSWGRKTDQERCQNLVNEIQEAYDNNVKFEVTIKLDGSSCTVGTSVDGEYVVCSRNMSLRTEQSGNTFVEVCKKHNLEENTKKFAGLLISAELMGSGVQGNKELLKEHDVYVFDVYDTRSGKYLNEDDRHLIVNKLGLKHVPVLYKSVTLRELGLANINDILAFADGPSLNNNKREGVVFKSEDGAFSFKAISNSWLIKNEKGE
jgi:RNA ligase (TIGR02306 family)